MNRGVVTCIGILAIIVACFVVNAHYSEPITTDTAVAKATAYAENMIPISKAEISGYVKTKEASTDSHGVQHPYGVYLGSGPSATFHLHNISTLSGNTASLKVIQAYGDNPGGVTIQLNGGPQSAWQTNSEMFIGPLQEGDNTITLSQPGASCDSAYGDQNCAYIAGISML